MIYNYFSNTSDLNTVNKPVSIEISGINRDSLIFYQNVTPEEIIIFKKKKRSKFSVSVLTCSAQDIGIHIFFAKRKKKKKSKQFLSDVINHYSH